METLRLVLLFLHVLGFAALLGGLVVQARDTDKAVNAAMRDGVGTAFVTGLLLVGVLEAGDTAVDHVKIAVKFAIALVLLVLVMANLRKPGIPQGLWAGLLVLTVLNIGVAIFWSTAHAA
jgi:hypothetical protein